MQKQWQDFMNSYTPNSYELTESCIVDLPDLGLLCVEGVDAKKFLQGQLTCNLEKISPTQTHLAAHCNPQGRIISLFRLFYNQERYYLQMPYSMIPLALAAFKKYAVFFKVTLSDASNQFTCIGYCGNQLHNYFSVVPEKTDEIVQSNELLILKLAGRFEIFGQFTPLSLLWKKLVIENQYATPEIWKHLDFKANIPCIYPETSEKFLPHEINLPKLNAISFDKGCYTGQEIIARMHYRGKVKNQLWHTTANTQLTPQRGADIYDQTNVAGTIVDYYKTRYNTYELQITTTKMDGLFLDSDRRYPIRLTGN